MALDQFQIFIAVAEREHVTRAANALGLVPPSVSAAVVSLEREFGTKLFHRVGRGIVVTKGGKLRSTRRAPSRLARGGLFAMRVSLFAATQPAKAGAFADFFARRSID